LEDASRDGRGTSEWILRVIGGEWNWLGIVLNGGVETGEDNIKMDLKVGKMGGE
jgi:hypothetical protein